MAFFALHPAEPLVLLSHEDLAREHARLLAMAGQLEQAVASHAVIDQAVGAVAALGGIAPEEAWRVLRDVSQRTNTKVRLVAEHVLDFVQGGTLCEPERAELQRAIDRYATLRRQAHAASPTSDDEDSARTVVGDGADR
ncbi:ANTAR domain-containing protein [Streptomyces sp. NPDC052225]|uniref:ANTAR domain-containing protein n=1 Tax=Streptomyces sp. NPDC052225 TaxID=3154949 RepID=UPI00344004D2